MTMHVDTKEILKCLKKAYPNARIALHYHTPMQLLAATILSAQCTDERVNMITDSIFKKYKTPEDFAKADIHTFEQEIRSCGFYHNKAKNIIQSAKLIVSKFGGQVPKDMESLVSLPGVARKTANVVLSNAYGIVEGIVVDTHVIRIAGRLGLTMSDTPEKIEHDLMRIVPRRDWVHISFLFQALGRTVCKARNPDHIHCVLMNICPSSHI